MSLFYPINKQKMRTILNTRILEFNVINDNIVYKELSKVPFSENDIIIKFDLMPYDKKFLFKFLKDDNYFFRFYKPIDLDVYKHQFLFLDNDEYLPFKSSISYSNIKYINQHELQSNPISFSNELPDIRNELILNKYTIKNSNYLRNKKGITMNIKYNYKINNTFCEKFQSYENFKENTNKEVLLLRENNLLQPSMLKSYKKLMKDIKAEQTKQLNEEISMLVQSKSILTGSKFNYTLSNTILRFKEIDFNLYQKILDLLISMDLPPIKYTINNFVKGIGKIIGQDNAFKEYFSDYNQLYNRVILQDYMIDVNTLSNNLFKNIFSFCCNFEDLNNLKKFLYKKDIPDYYISLELFGVFYGYTFKEKNNIEYDSFKDSIYSQSINILQDKYFGLSNTSEQYYRFLYILIKFINKFYSANDCPCEYTYIDKYIVKQSKDNFYYNLIISDKSNSVDSLVIQYMPYNNSISSKPFNSYMDNIKKVYDLSKDKDIINNKLYVTYTYRFYNKIIPINPLLQHKYTICLNKLLNIIKGDEISE